MMPVKKWCILTIALLCLLLLHHPGQGAAPGDDALVQRAKQNLAQENYDEAVADLTQSWQQGPRTAEKAFLLGQAYRLMLNYPTAKEYLEEAVRLAPNDRGAQLSLADTLLALEQPKEAKAILLKLEASGYEPGKTAFLLGMVAIKENRYSEALEYFRKAQQDPKVAQEAMFQESLALAALNRVKEARKTLEGSIALNAQSQTSEFAQRYLGVLERRVEETRPFHFNVTAGFDYDSNVTLNPGGVSSATLVSGQGDAVFTQTAALEYNIHAAGPFSVLTQYAYFQNFHPRLSTFDVMSHYVGLVPTYGFKNSRLWVPISFNYADVQADKYYTGYLVAPTYLYLFNEHWGLEVGGRFNRLYYWNQIFFPQDDRSGKELGGNVGLYYFFKKQKGFLQARVSYDHYYTTGSNWDNSTYRLLLACLYPVTDKFRVNVFLDGYLQPYNNTFFNGVTFGNASGGVLVPQPQRNDQALIFGLQMLYEVYKGIDVNLHYYAIRDKSNIPLYNYNRQIVGLQLGYRY